MRGWIFLLFVGLGLQASDGFSPEGLEFFEKRIRPALIAHCYECHSAERGQQKGGLRLDTRAGILQGGDSGPAAIVGQPENSLLVRAIHRLDDDLRMPPKKDLPADQIRDFEAWIKMGLPDPRTTAAPATTRYPASAEPFDWEKERQFWSFQPLRPSDSPESSTAQLVDYWVSAALTRRHLSPNPEADRATLLRRLSYDLTGLPPKPDDVDAFLADPSPRAYERRVERLLDSPRFGEHFGRHWLDLARYADTAGDSSDYPIPEAVRYRDYVVAAFNADKPYDRFLREQIAGDLLPFRNRDERNEQLVATGFIALSRRFGVGQDPFELTIDDTIDTLSKTALGLTVSCARCHDHKYDPVSQRDYYALYGVFQSTRYPFPGAETDQRPHDLVPLIPDEEVAALLQPSQARLAELDAAIQRLSAAQPTAQPGTPAPAPAQELAQLRRERRTLLDTRPNVPSAFAVSEGRAADAPVFLRGERWRPGPMVPRGVPTVFGGQPFQLGATNSGRLELAHWLTSPNHPLTARVYVNRVWQWLFGRGLVATPSDFGRRGELPSHPELLDALAARFMEEGWSTKELVRQLVLSQTYRRSAATYGPNQLADPDNRLLWRGERRRLSAEELRDSVLFASGTLELEPGLAHPFPPKSRWNFTQHFQFTADYTTAKRSLYLMQQRIQRQPFLALFDGPDPNASTAGRTLTTSPLQALYLLNHPFLHGQAAALVQRIEAAGSRSDRLTLLWRRTLGRGPTADERGEAERFLGEAPDTAAWEGLARALLASNEFAFVD